MTAPTPEEFERHLHEGPTLAEHGRYVRDLMRGIYSADIADLMAERDRLRQGLWDTWVALGHDTDGDANPGALIAGMGVDGFIRMVVTDAQTWRRESEDDYAADTDRLRARAEKAERALTAPLRREDLEEAVSALGYVHSDYCISTRPCRCSAIADRLEAAIKSMAD